MSQSGLSDNGSSVPPLVQELQQACERFVEEAVGVALDRTSDTLPLLDHYFSQIPRDASSALLDLVLPAAGAYFGEVVRTGLGSGAWHTAGDDFEQWSFTFPKTSLKFNPIGLAHEVFRQAGNDGAFEMSPAERAVAEPRLAALGEIAEEDYYRFSVRFETLEQLMSALTEP